MAISIDLEPGVERALRQKAARNGQDLAAFLSQLAAREAAEVAPPGATLAQTLEGRLGVVDSSTMTAGQPSRLSEDEGAYGRYLEARHREGHV